MVAGYSKRSLIDKLGIKSGFKIAILQPFSEYERLLGPLPDGVTQINAPSGALDFIRLDFIRLDFIQYFTTRRHELEAEFPTLKKALASAGMLWISWPKGSSQIVTDLNENRVREIGLQNGLVDVKVIAVDERWSGLKFVYRLADRN
jgi:hypothetical protein